MHFSVTKILLIFILLISILLILINGRRSEINKELDLYLGGVKAGITCTTIEFRRNNLNPDFEKIHECVAFHTKNYFKKEDQ